MPGTTDGGNLGIALLDYPVSVKGDPQASSWIVVRLIPGSVNTQHIKVFNTTNASMTVNIDAGAATNENGVFNFAPEGVGNLLTSWTSIKPSSGVIPANSSMEASVTITVPSDAVPSMQYGVIWASQNALVSKAGVAITNRVGIRMYNPVGNYSLPTPTPTATTTGTPVVVVHNKSTELFGVSQMNYQWIALGIVFLLVLTLFRVKRGRRSTKGS